MDWLNLKTIQQVWQIIEEINPLEEEEEEVHLDDALGRVLAEDLTTSTPFPLFDRSAMDGFAVRAQDTFGASEANPLPLEVCGEVRMGELTTSTLKPGTAMKVATGGMLPQGADAVIMIEHTQRIDEVTIQILRAVAPGENVIHRGEDLKEGEVILQRGHVLRPQDSGPFAALGIDKIKVYRRPCVGICSTGDEICPIDANVQGGEIRDINRYTLSAMTLWAGGKPKALGIAKDDFTDLQARIKTALPQVDVVLISGGSSVGTRDLTFKVIESIPGVQLLVHGVAVSPGKPTILAKVKEKLIWGLPGHPVSAMVIFMVLVAPSLMRLSGRYNWLPPYHRPIKAYTARNIPSTQGREDYVRVKLSREEGRWIATPIFGKSGVISTIVKSDGLIRIPLNCEGISAGDEVEVWPF